MDGGRLNSARQLLLERATSALAELVEDDPPEALVNSELRNRAARPRDAPAGPGHRPSSSTWPMTGQDPATLDRGADGAPRPRRSRSTSRCGPWPTPRASRSPTTTSRPSTSASPSACNQKPNQVRKAYERNDAVSGPTGARSARRKALEWLLDHVEIVDPEGQPIDRELLLPPDEELAVPGEVDPPATRDDHDHAGHDHDHAGHDHDHDHPPTNEAENARDRARLQLPGPHRRRADQPGRAGLRPLLAGCSRRTSSSWARRSTTRSPT